MLFRSTRTIRFRSQWCGNTPFGGTPEQPGDVLFGLFIMRGRNQCRKSSSKGQSQLLGKVEIKQVAILQTTDTVKIENVEIVKALNSNDEIQIRANIGKLDIVSINANIKIEKGSKIKQVVLPSEVDKFEKGKGRYEKENFKLVIEDPSDIEGGTNNKAGEFKFLTNKEISELDNKTYKDGVYFGDGFGFVEAKLIPVKVTVSRQGISS